MYKIIKTLNLANSMVNDEIYSIELVIENRKPVYKAIKGDYVMGTSNKIKKIQNWIEEDAKGWNLPLRTPYTDFRG